VSFADQLRAELRAELKAAGISQAEAARHLGCTPKHMSQMLTGKARISPEWANAVALACGRRLIVASTPLREPE
jgi:plasmid maintenance system antidote protein VapI